MKKSMLAAVVVIAVLGTQGCTVYMSPPAQDAHTHSPSYPAHGHPGKEGVQGTLAPAVVKKQPAPVTMQRSTTAPASAELPEPEMPAAADPQVAPAEPEIVKSPIVSFLLETGRSAVINCITSGNCW